MNVEQLKKQAKELVRAARAGDPDALARLGDLPARLAGAQLVLAREHGYSSWPALVRVEVEQPFHTDLEYYEGRADGIATVNGVSVTEARRDLAGRHGFSSWAALRRHVLALAKGEEPPTPFLLAYRAIESRDVPKLAALLRTRGSVRELSLRPEAVLLHWTPAGPAHAPPEAAPRGTTAAPPPTRPGS